MTAINRPAIRYHGGKFRLAPWITSHFPKHQIYCESFGGAASVLLNKPRSHGEIYNDLDSDVVNFFKVLRDPDTCKALEQALQLTPYSREEFDNAWEPSECRIEQARRLCVRAQQGFGSGGATKGITGFRLDTKRKGCNAQHIWSEFSDTIALIGQRFQGVLIENRDAIQVMLDHDSSETLHYLDPPYLPSTREKRCAERGIYNHEMTRDEHQTMLETAKSLDGMVVISGYESPLYQGILKDWRCVTKKVAAGGKTGSVNRQECLWISPNILDKQMPLPLDGH